MSPVKKLMPITFQRIDEAKALWALEIQAIVNLDSDILPTINSSEDHRKKMLNEYTLMFEDEYGHSYWDTFLEIFRWDFYFYSEERRYSYNEIYKTYLDCLDRANKEPCKIHKIQERDLLGNYEWTFQGYIYEVNGFYTDDQIKLLILQDFDQELRYFERLKTKFVETTTKSSFERQRIPESVRIEVWRRDEGKCARCGSREKLEYDHIVPISKGGSNTARNIELLCEKHNRSKSNNVV